MKAKNIKFTCQRCHSPVYRLGVKVDIDAKLCGLCKGKKNVYSPRLEEMKSESEMKEIDAVTEYNVHAQLRHYRSLLDRVEELLKTNPTETFYELYRQARESRL